MFLLLLDKSDRLIVAGVVLKLENMHYRFQYMVISIYMGLRRAEAMMAEVLGTHGRCQVRDQQWFPNSLSA